jgi:hypothetical protein
MIPAATRNAGRPDGEGKVFGPAAAGAFGVGRFGIRRSVPLRSTRTTSEFKEEITVFAE